MLYIDNILRMCVLKSSISVYSPTATSGTPSSSRVVHDDVIKWKYFPRYWPFERGVHRSPVNSPHKGQWRGALMFSLICVWINGWVNNREAGDLRRHRAHYDVTVMVSIDALSSWYPPSHLVTSGCAPITGTNGAWPTLTICKHQNCHPKLIKAHNYGLVQDFSNSRALAME